MASWSSSSLGSVIYNGVWNARRPAQWRGCGNGLRTEFALLSKSEQCDDGNSYSDLRVGDGIDEDCNGSKDVSIL